MRKTTDEILEAMTALMDAAEDRDLTAEEIGQYEALERELAQAKKNSEARERYKAYKMTVVPAGRPRPRSDSESALTDEDRGFEAFLRTGQPNADISHLRATGEDGMFVNAQGSGTTAGGYTVPTGFRQKLVEVRKSFGGFANYVDEINTTTGAPLEYPTLDDTANEGDITAESAVVSSGADLVFGTVTLGAYKYTSAGAGSNLPLRVPVELLQDSAFDVTALVSRKLGQRIARKQAAHWVTGTGSGQPLGIVAASLTADRDLDTADTPDYEDLVDFQDLLDEEYDQNAYWLMKRNTWSQLRLIVDMNGRPLIQSSTEGIAGRPERRLLDKPVIIDEGMPTLSSAGDTFCIAYGDFREAYVLRRVSSLVVVVNPYSRASYGEVEFTAWERADGTIQNRSAYKILQNNT